VVGNDLPLWFAIVEMGATDMYVDRTQRCLALQQLCACFERLVLPVRGPPSSSPLVSWAWIATLPATHRPATISLLIFIVI
jgi:hypothetical protein